jgi:hypothetical protein
MWEAKAATGRTDELVAWALEHAVPAAAVYRSTDGRVVVIDASATGLPDVPAELVTRPPHVWPFVQVRG